MKDDYRNNPAVIALSAEYAKLEARQQQIFEELQSEFPAPDGFTWGASACKKHPLRLWSMAEEDR